MTVWRKAYIALGSNLGDRREAVDGALAALAKHDAIAVLRVSRIIETAPVGPAGQRPYLNAAAELRTRLDPRELLACFLEIEATFGRRRTKEKWGPRTLDIDLLLFGDEGEVIVDEPGLKVPHPHLHERGFVLEPLAEIAGSLVHPVLQQPVHVLRDRVLVESAAMKYAGAEGKGA